MPTELKSHGPRHPRHPRHSRQPMRALALAAGLALSLGLVACDRSPPEPAEPTVGQRIDQGVASVERQAEAAGDRIAQAGDQAAQTLRDATATAVDRTRDVAITAKVNAELARDTELSALKIDVDTVDGRVALNGSAPHAAARTRAEMLAAKVDGVVAVDNRLTVASSS